MAIVTYSNADYGFGVTYDDAPITLIDDRDDPRLRAAWSTRVPLRTAVSVLFTTHGASVDAIAGGHVPSLLLATDCLPLRVGVLGGWDWAEQAERRGRPFLATTRAPSLEAVGLYWRGFPVLQLTTVPATDGEPPAPVECLSLLHTPAQTFAIELVMPVGHLDTWSQPFQEVADGFFLMPIEREGNMRTGHQHAWSRHMDVADREDDLADGLAAR